MTAVRGRHDKAKHTDIPSRDLVKGLEFFEVVPQLI